MDLVGGPLLALDPRSCFTDWNDFKTALAGLGSKHPWVGVAEALAHWTWALGQYESLRKQPEPHASAAPHQSRVRRGE